MYKSIYEYEDWVYIEIERKFEQCFMNLLSIYRYLMPHSSLKLEIHLLRRKIAIYSEEKNIEGLFNILIKLKNANKEIQNHIKNERPLISLEESIVNRRLSSKLRTITEGTNFLEKLLSSLRDNPHDILKESLNYFIKSVFKSNICRHGTKKAWIRLSKNYLEIEKNKISNLECRELIDNKKNILFIESPFLLKIFEQITKLTKPQIPFYRKRREKYILPYHIEDLINQIRGYEGFWVDDNSLLRKIENIVKGKLKYSPLKEDILFQENKRKVPAINTASGILTFGVLDLLLQSGAFDENTILIFEEPETNLHPEWQIKIVEILKAIMEEKAVQMFLTTHSPFIVKAVEVLALEDKSFKENLSINLLYEDGKTVCDFEESTEKIYDQLLGPFSTLMFKGWFYE